MDYYVFVIDRMDISDGGKLIVRYKRIHQPEDSLHNAVLAGDSAVKTKYNLFSLRLDPDMIFVNKSSTLIGFAHNHYRYPTFLVDNSREYKYANSIDLEYLDGKVSFKDLR